MSGITEEGSWKEMIFQVIDPEFLIFTVASKAASTLIAKAPLCCKYGKKCCGLEPADCHFISFLPHKKCCQVFFSGAVVSTE